MQGPVENEDDQLQSFFLQLLLWRFLAEEYKRLITSVMPIVNDEKLSAELQALTDEFKNLYSITETDRGRYMQKLKEQDGYGQDYNAVVNRIIRRFASSADESKPFEGSEFDESREN